jgi:hypothetical protein
MRKPAWILLLLFSISLLFAVYSPAKVATATPVLVSEAPILIVEIPALFNPL